MCQVLWWPGCGHRALGADVLLRRPAHHRAVYPTSKQHAFQAPGHLLGFKHWKMVHPSFLFFYTLLQMRWSFGIRSKTICCYTKSSTSFSHLHMHNVHPFREAADCDKKKITERVLDKNEQDLLKATPAHLVSDVNKDELQKRVSMCFVLEIVFL